MRCKALRSSADGHSSGGFRYFSIFFAAAMLLLLLLLLLIGSMTASAASMHSRTSHVESCSLPCAGTNHAF